MRSEKVVRKALKSYERLNEKYGDMTPVLNVLKWVLSEREIIGLET